MTTKSITPVTEAQRKHFLRLVEDAARKALEEVRPSREGLQRIFSDKGFQPEFVQMIRKFSGADTVESSEFIFIPGQHASPYSVKDIAQQVKIIRHFFPALESVEVCAEFSEHKSVCVTDGFAIPPWQLLGRTYAMAVGKVVDALRISRGNYFEDRLKCFDNHHLCECSSKASHMSALNIFARTEFGSIMVVLPAQLGFSKRACSATRAEKEVKADEIPLGLYEVAIILLTHPERLQSNNDIGINCAGDRYAHDRNDFSYSPCFSFKASCLVLDSLGINNSDDHFGYASGFSPTPNEEVRV